MIYKTKDIERLAGELLVEDFMKNKKFHFTNTSYGGRGDTLGTIAYKDNHSEHLIQYRLYSESWGDEKFKLVKYTEDITYKSEKTEYSKIENEEIIKVLYAVSSRSYDNNVYTDDEEYAKEAGKTRAARYGKYNTKQKTVFRERQLKVGTKLYDKMFTFAANKSGKPLKYGTSVKIDYSKSSDRKKYSYSENAYDIGFELQSGVTVEYRNKDLYVRKSNSFVKTGTVKY